MRTRCLDCLRNHIHLWLILPLVVIVATWPTFPRLFDVGEFWVHNQRWGILRIMWDTWHLERVLAGQAELWYNFDTFHPQGMSMVFQLGCFPYALLLLALKIVMPADNANNLIFLLILFFNGCSAYVLVLHLLKDKWVALFGAVVTALGVAFSSSNAYPTIVMIGTMPLTLYFFLRALTEDRLRLAALAGFCAGITAFIGLYTLIFILASTAILAAFRLPTRWRQREFWRLLLLFALICAAISAMRVYPILADTATREAGMSIYEGRGNDSNDVLNFFVLSRNPYTGGVLHSLFNIPSREILATAYLGYINIFFLACALLRARGRDRLLPWLALFVFFAIMQLGDFLTFNGVAYRDSVLPARIVREILPFAFGQIGYSDYYLFALITPWALLSCFGLAALIHGRSARTRALVALAAVVVVAFEYRVPFTGLSVPKGATAYVDWLASEPDEPIKVINLPRLSPLRRWGVYTQSLTGYPTAYGSTWRNRAITAEFVDRNWLLREWNKNRSGSCFGRGSEYDEALDELLSDGFTHIVIHQWGPGTKTIENTFALMPVVYDDGMVSIYRLRDMRAACTDLAPELYGIEHFLQSSRAVWQPGAWLLSFHPSDQIDEDQLAFVDASIAYTTDWAGLPHLYVDEGEPVFQTAAGSDLNVEDFTEQSQQIYVVYESAEADPPLLTSMPPLDQFQTCGRQSLADRWVVERLLRREFACALLDSPAPLEAHYDNGAHLANYLVTQDGERLDVQMRWGALPEARHAISIQLFDTAGSKVHNQDFIVKSVALASHRLDISALLPGQYDVKLILYDFYTGNSASGRVNASGVRFERELEIATIYRS